MNTNNENKPHPHAEVIKAWADGAKIQWFDSYDSKWKDTVDNTPMWDDKIQYRIKPDGEEPGKPKIDDLYFFLNFSEGEVYIDCRIWLDEEIDDALYRLHNIFRTEQEADAAIPCVEAALKGVFSKGINVATDVNRNVGSNVGSPELDGKPLTDGEIALIKALINAGGIYEVFKFEKTLLVANLDNGAMSVSDGHVAFITERGGARSVAIIRALNQIKAEQEARND